ncbi:MAG: hypothetical protein ACRD0J_11020, partial [Acidimicrobiales bacterium]
MSPTRIEAGRRQALEDERDFALRSLTDLDREWEDGGLDEADYQALRSSYTARAAAAIRDLGLPAVAGPEPHGLEVSGPRANQPVANETAAAP